jgi:hypothetical protein
VTEPVLVTGIVAASYGMTAISVGVVPTVTGSVV